MSDPFKIAGWPTCISFSGGRTSAYMLWRVLIANGGLPADAVVCFQNTGREMPETLDFVYECSWRWNVPIVWLEFDTFVPPGRSKCLYRIVDHATASRDGEPFSRLNRLLGILPNPVARTCTSYLKIKTMTAYLHDKGWDEWDVMLGIRADEPRRAARMTAPGRDNRAGEPNLPLVAAGISSSAVADFWNAHPFDLRLPGRNGKTMHGNCDLCFLKPAAQVRSLIAEKPSRATWWIAEERDAGGTFRNDRASYAAMAKNASDQTDAFGFNEEPISCYCGE